MKVAIIYNKDLSKVINRFGIQNKEIYNPENIKRVAKSLESRGHNVSVIDGNMHMIEKLQQFMPKVMDGEKMGMVFNMAYGIQGESRYSHLPSMLEMLGIPYVGSNPAGHTMALDKVLTKILMEKHGIPTPDFWVFNSADEDMTDVKYPVIVKPKMEAVSYGLQVVDNIEDLKKAVKTIIDQYQQGALVEQFIRGREFCVGLLGNLDLEAFPVLEIDLNGDPDAIQTVSNKKSAPRGKICPADIPEELANEMVHWSKKAFHALHLRDFSRVDIRMDENNQIYLLEINSMASLGRTGSYVHAAQKAGYDFPALVNKMLDVACSRYFLYQYDESLNQITENGSPDQIKVPVHSKIRSFIRGREENLKKLLKSSVNINTYFRNIDGVNEYGFLLKKSFSQLGFQVESKKNIELGNTLLFKNTDSEKLDVLFLSHLDNKESLSDFIGFSEDDTRYYGSGIWSSKGGLVALISAFQTLRFLKILKKLKIGVLLIPDSQLYGKFSEQIIGITSTYSKQVIALSGGGEEGTVVTSRPGTALYKLFLNLKNGDSENHLASAIQMFTKSAYSLAGLTNQEEGIVVIPSKMTLTGNISSVNADGKCDLSVRFNNTESFKMIDMRIRKVISQKKNKKVEFKIEGGLKRPPMNPGHNSESLLQKLTELGKKLDIRIIKEHRWSSSDIGYAHENLSVIDGLGPTGNSDGNGSEYIYRHSLLERAELIALFLTHLNSDEKQIKNNGF